MLDARRRNRTGLSESSDFFWTGVGSRIRVFGLLALMVPLFAGLQYLAIESAPRVEVRVVAQEPTGIDSVQAPPERVVERVVYVPVTRSETAQLSDTGPALPVAERRAQASGGPTLGGLDSAGAPRVEAAPEQMAVAQALPDSESAADPAEAPTPHMGLLAVATPVSVPVPAPAPVIAAAPVSRAVAPQPVLEPVDDDDTVADADVPDDEADGEAVADEPADSDGDQQEVAQIQFIDTTIEADQSTRVVSYKIPVRPEAVAVPPAGGDAPSDNDPAVADAPGEPAADDADVADAADANEDVADAASTEDDDADDEVAKVEQDHPDEAASLEAVAAASIDEVAADLPDEVAADAPSQDDDDEQTADGEGGDDAVGEADPADDSNESPEEADAQETPQLSAVLATTAGGIAVEAEPGQ